MKSGYEQDKSIKTIQGNIRSLNRYNLHFSAFAQYPVSAEPVLKIPSEYPELLSRLNKIINKMAMKQKIINEKKLYHCTTLPNLLSIIKHGYFYGNATLRRKKIIFSQNVYDPCSDGKNADEHETI